MFFSMMSKLNNINFIVCLKFYLQMTISVKYPASKNYFTASYLIVAAYQEKINGMTRTVGFLSILSKKKPVRS